MVDISVILCTYNRCEVLKETLASFASMDLPANGQLELLIVDNRSTDATRSISTDFVTEHGYARYIHEATQGLSHARNTGISESCGKIIAFVDDDVFFDHNWLKAVMSAFDSQPEMSALGGKSIPLFDGGQPDWMNDEFLKAYGDTQFGNERRMIQYPDHPFGLNMAFRREVFDHVGNFDPDLGRKKSSLLSNEESDLFQRIAFNGLHVLYDPEALLYHRIPKDRVSLKWIRERHYWQGISDVIQKRGLGGTGRSALIADALTSVSHIFRIACGGHLSPKRVYWNYQNITVTDKVRIFYQLGRIRQDAKQALLNWGLRVEARPHPRSNQERR